ncbi:hypothetical protein L226DRAFT_261169 [Lentinus tigrinus ALCF2SS1-7]|uniref:uncharacterized protein n=1 Tax=Lentinus tigrinus ALCF2SS1-7 TaxID=1328758 RepID=UPI001165D9B4|nr:hypothetical protein L226DRAFT_261169 [Lentinus tigrinus ALCF2SS1-7]
MSLDSRVVQSVALTCAANAVEVRGAQANTTTMCSDQAATPTLTVPGGRARHSESETCVRAGESEEGRSSPRPAIQRYMYISHPMYTGKHAARWQTVPAVFRRVHERRIRARLSMRSCCTMMMVVVSELGKNHKPGHKQRWR